MALYRNEDNIAGTLFANISGKDSEDYITEEILQEALNSKSDVNHMHQEYVTTNSFTEVMNRKSDINHTHSQYITSDDLDDYATLTYVNSAIAQAMLDGQVDLSDYATLDDLEDYVTTSAFNEALSAKSDYNHTHSEYASLNDITGYVDSAIEDSMATKADINHIHSQYLTDDDLDDYATTEMLSQKQDTLYFDNYPTRNSTSPVTSGGVYSAIDSLNNRINQLNSLSFSVVFALPVEDISTNIIYLVPKEDAEEDNIYNEYVYINDNWELLGSTQIDLSGYVTNDELDEELASKQDTLLYDNTPTANSDNMLKSGAIYTALQNIPSGGGSGSSITVDSSLSDTSENPVQNKVIKQALDNKANANSIPTKTSDLTNDSGFLTTHQDISGKQDVLTFDNTPTQNSNNPVKSGGVYTALANKVDNTSIGSASGVAELDANGKVPSSQLPSFVDDVVEGYYNTVDNKFYSSYENEIYSNEISGESGKIYTDLISNKTYRWSGSGFVEISESIALGETSSTAYRGDRGKTAYDHSQITSGNPHNVTATDVGLGNVNNTSDLNKPISTAMQSALDLKQNILTFDSTPTENSSNPVTSGGVYAALQNSGSGSGSGGITFTEYTFSSGSNDAVEFLQSLSLSELRLTKITYILPLNYGETNYYLGQWGLKISTSGVSEMVSSEFNSTFSANYIDLYYSRGDGSGGFIFNGQFTINNDADIDYAYGNINLAVKIPLYGGYPALVQDINKYNKTSKTIYFYQDVRRLKTIKLYVPSLS